MGKADLHVHTSHSDGMADAQELLEYVESQTDLDVLAITDHDDLSGALATREAWARRRYRFEVIMGMEVTTIEGHLLALFIEEPVQCLRPLEETLAAVHRQGGLCVIPHPYTWLTRGLGDRAIRRVLAGKRAGVHFDGIEVTNGTPAGRLGAQRAKKANDAEFSLAEVGGSDAHFLDVVGCGYTDFAGTTAEELREAILARETRGVALPYPTIRQIGYGQTLRQTYRGIMCTPRAMGWGPTAWSFVRRIVTVR
jgi:predicted metal-dependent phosphoesterase TrpH